MRQPQRIAALLLVVGGVTLPAGATAAGRAARWQRSSFSGACSFSGSIRPDPAITLLPHQGARFSYSGSGACAGVLDGKSVSGVPDRVTFAEVPTTFDTCEVGPDFDLPGTLTLTIGRTTSTFAITIYLARVGGAGPFALTTPRRGRAIGTATFEPADPVTAAAACGGAGVSTATLAASFRTAEPLRGTRPTNPPESW
jgi:hypothetical protein